MRRKLWMASLCGAVIAGLSIQRAGAQPGHAPFTFGALEIEDYERTLVPNGVANATIVFDGAVPGFHPAAIAAGQPSVPYKTGAPIYLEDSASAYEQYGGILGHQGGGTVTPTNFENIFPGGTTMSPGGFPNGGEGRNQPNTPASYNGTKISLVTRTDANTADDVGITSGNQALRISMLNVGQGDGDTSFDRPASLVIKPTDYWGVADSRFDTFEAVRANPNEYSVSIDVTYLANEIPDQFSTQLTQPYFRLGFYSAHAGLFTESPTNFLQGPPSLVFGNVDGDGDGLPNFTDPTYVDPNNPSNLPGFNVPGVIQRHYVFPASAMRWPAAPLAGVADGGNRVGTGATGFGLANGYMIGFVFNGNWLLNTSASFIVDNFKFIPRNPIDHADFNDDNLLNVLDWNILVANLNGLAPPAKTFAMGDVGSHPDESAVSPGIVDFADFARFEEIWDANNGGAGAFQAFLAGVPEPTSLGLLLLASALVATCRRRAARQVVGLFAVAVALSCCSTATAALSNTLLFGWEPPPDPNLQLWQPAGDAANTTTPPVLSAGPSSATGATQGSTRSLQITQTGNGFSWDAAVSIFGGEMGLPTQQAAFNNALDIGANHFALEFDVVYRDAMIPDTGFVNMSVRLNAGGGSTDQVDNVALAGDGTGPVPDQTIPVSIPLSIVPVDTGDTVLSVPDQASLAGFYNLTLAFNGDWSPGGAAATFFVDNMRLRQVTQPPLLTLEVNQATGAATIKNVAGPDSGSGEVMFSYYEIRSVQPTPTADYNENGTVEAADYVLWRNTRGQTVPANTGADGDGDGMVDQDDYNLYRAQFGEPSLGVSLNPAGWNSLDTQNTDAVDGADAGTVAGNSPLEGWDKSGSPSSTVLSEAFLLGNSTWSQNESLSIGNIFVPNANKNLQFRYREPGRPGFLRTGIVTYVGGAGSSVETVVAPEPSAAALLAIGILARLTCRGRSV